MADDSAKALRTEFARRLQKAMLAKGFNQSDLAREASKHMPPKKAIRRDSVSKYLKAVTFPSPLALNAVSRALGVAPEDLVPAGKANLISQMADNPALALSQTGDNTARLRINQEVPMDTAMKILKLLRSE